jgi:hypothetical protein
MSKTLFVGRDVSSKRHTVCLTDPEGNPLGTQTSSKNDQRSGGMTPSARTIARGQKRVRPLRVRRMGSRA